MFTGKWAYNWGGGISSKVRIYLQVNGPIPGRELLSGRAYERQFTVCYKK